ncbi:MAG: LysE family transporter, partial [Proteobacteria bacterium]|nr:LysE family transporter [Pseudomonadota bacterium]
MPIDSLPLFVKGLLVGIMVAAPMGPVNVLCIQRTVTRGRVEGFLTGMGAAIGDAAFALLAALGLTAVASFIESNEIWFRLPGGLLLLAMAVYLWRSHPHLEAQDSGGNGLKRNIVATFVLTVSNPITLAAFFSFFIAWGMSTGFDIVAATNVVA